jgi:hypothetical protein
VEAQSGANGELASLRDFASKAAEHAARIAGMLTVMHDIHAGAIELAEMESAVTLVNWYLGEAERLQSIARRDPRLLKASALLEWFKSQGKMVIQLRDIVRLRPSRIPNEGCGGSGDIRPARPSLACGDFEPPAFLQLERGTKA